MKKAFIDTTERLAATVRTSRIELGLTQAELAERANVGRRFIVDLEKGHPRAEIGKTLAVLREVGVQPLAMPISPSRARHQ